MAVRQGSSGHAGRPCRRVRLHFSCYEEGEAGSPNTCSHTSIPSSAPWRCLGSSPAVHKEDGRRAAQSSF